MNPAALETAWAENFSSRGELGASVSVWRSGREIVNLAGGYCDREKTQPWSVQTPVLVWSATKGPAAACALHALERRGLNLDTAVAEVWPEFGSSGKAGITFGELLSHRAGLPAFTGTVDVHDYEAVIRAIERQPPLWETGRSHGYHPRTFGYLLDEAVRRLSGMPLADYWQRVFASPLGLDFWIGIPAGLQSRVAPIFASRTAPPEDDFLRAFADSDSLTNRAFSSPKGLHSASSMNTPEARSAAFPGFGGIGTASALGKFYALLAHGGSLEGVTCFSAQTLGWMETSLSDGFDQVLRAHTAFSAGFMKDPVDAAGRKMRSIFGPSLRAFGQPGAGGSVAFADPENDLAFAYVMNQMEPGVFPNARATALIRALYE
jgi:CubicO group peptidase (beta-lactamase class C family)